MTIHTIMTDHIIIIMDTTIMVVITMVGIITTMVIDTTVDTIMTMAIDTTMGEDIEQELVNTATIETVMNTIDTEIVTVVDITATQTDTIIMAEEMYQLEEMYRQEDIVQIILEDIHQVVQLGLEVDMGVVGHTLEVPIEGRAYLYT